MKILLHSYAFFPNIGGIETATHNLAVGLGQLGHEVTVMTDVLINDDLYTVEHIPFPYKIIRTRDPRVRSRCIRMHDVVHATGTFPSCFPHALRHDKPFSWTHQNYRLQAIDGLGWCDSGPAPMTPIDSYRFHSPRMGRNQALKQLGLLYGRRMIANLAAANVAITQHVNSRQPAPRQRVIYNPVDCSFFRAYSMNQAVHELNGSDATFSFVGRLVSEKGVSDLIRAFALVVRCVYFDQSLSLKIIGDGPERPNLEGLAKELNVADRIRFVGALSGEALRKEIRRSGVFVLPSAWEEPMGIVAVELMSAGKPLIVSEVGGLSECAGEACVTFENRNVELLAEALLSVSGSARLQTEMAVCGMERAKVFEVPAIARQYSEMFEDIRAGRTGSRAQAV